MPGVQNETTENRLPDVAAFRDRILSGKRRTNHLYAMLLGINLLKTEELLNEVATGFPFSTIERLGRNMDIPIKDLAELAQIGNRTLHRRKEEGRLQPDESDRLLRVSRVFAKAIELFEGDDHAAMHWLSTPQRALSGVAPLTLTKTEFGALEVERLIGRLEHGVFS
jgi:putative toxin-antitoxin system antitoxin component (TIGR02293 family)